MQTCSNKNIRSTAIAKQSKNVVYSVGCTTDHRLHWCTLRLWSHDHMALYKLDYYYYYYCYYYYITAL